jgi:hypothetical protein
MPPRLCSAINPDAVALNPGWWARGEWRLERRIITPDAASAALAVLTVHLCRHHADLTGRPNAELVAYTIGSPTITNVGYLDTPHTPDQWMDLHTAIYSQYMGVLSNMTGTPPQQQSAAAQLRTANTLAAPPSYLADKPESASAIRVIALPGRKRSPGSPEVPRCAWGHS